MSKTTYSSKSMSSCSVCINPAYNTNQVYSSLKSMSLCKSTPNDDIPDVSTDEMPESKSSKTSKPSNSTFLDEHLNVEFKDIIFEDLSPITGKLRMMRVLHCKLLVPNYGKKTTEQGR